MEDKDHSLLDHAVHVLQHPWVLVNVQSQVVSANARVFRSRKFAKPFAAKNIVLNASKLGDVDAGLERILGSLLRLIEHRKGALLIRGWLAKHQGSADL